MKATKEGELIESRDFEQPRQTVLIAILGTAPAVLTEAVWALAKNEGVVPDRVVVMTTASGKDKLRKMVLESGVWERLKGDLASEGVTVDGKLVFNPESDRFLMTFIDEKTGKFVEDLPTREANLQAANQMLGQIRDYTDDRNWQVIGLMAGGRKTMTGLFFSVMGLLARRGDRICHVLVSEPYENPKLDPPFFYPRADGVHRLDGADYPSSSARINLFDVPFVRIGDWAEQKCRALSRKLTYENLIQSVEESMDKALMPNVTLDLATGDVVVNGEPAELSETEFMFFLFLAQFKDPDMATKALADFAAYIDDQGEEAVDECKCTWLEKFKDTKLFLRNDAKNQEEQKKLIKNDRSRVKNRLKDKLQAASPWFVDGKRVRCPPFETIEIVSEDYLSPEVYERMFPKRPLAGAKRVN